LLAPIISATTLLLNLSELKPCSKGNKTVSVGIQPEINTMSTSHPHRRTLPIALAFLTALAMVAPATVGGATPQDKWPSDCGEYDEEQFQNSTGVSTGVLDVPADQDAFWIQLDRGDYVTMSALVPEAHNYFRIKVYTRQGNIVARNRDTEDGVFDKEDDGDMDIGDQANGSDSSWQIWANENSTICIAVEETTEQDAEFPYEWQIRLQKNSPTIENSGHQVLSQKEAEQQRQQLTSLKKQVDRLNETVAEQQERINELENRLNQTVR
jgi:hypothetical protein